MNIYEKVYKACSAIYPGQVFEPGRYDQYVKNPFFFPEIIKNIDKINHIYRLLKKSRLPLIQRTPGGSIARNNIHHISGAWDCREVWQENHQLKGVIITVIVKNTVFVFKCGNFKVNKSEMTGSKAFNIFKKVCAKAGINIDDYKIKDGKEVKATIESPLIKMFKRYERLEHVNHLDINSAWAWGVCQSFPAFTGIFDALKHKDKLIANMALGYCQSRYIGYSLANLSKAGIENCNKQVERLMERLIAEDFEIVGINTDGIWYQAKNGDFRLYHDENEGGDLGQWKNDHKDCEFLAYSDGQYWYKEKGKFHPVARGFYSYERIKAREEWNEADFDFAIGSQIIVEWDPEEGFITYETRSPE